MGTTIEAALKLANAAIKSSTAPKEASRTLSEMSSPIFGRSVRSRTPYKRSIPKMRSKTLKGVEKLVEKQAKKARPAPMPLPQANLTARDKRAKDGVCPFTNDQIAKMVVTAAQIISEKKFYPPQVDFAWGVTIAILRRKSDKLTALFSRQSGKSEVASSTMIAVMIILPTLAGKYQADERFVWFDDDGREWGYRQGFNIGLYAPSEGQALITFNRSKNNSETVSAKRMFREENIKKTTSNGQNLTLAKFDQAGNKRWSSTVACCSAAPTAKIEGKTYHMMICEEAQDIEDQIMTKSLWPMMASTNGTRVMIGTANARKCEFLRVIKENRRKETSDNVKRHYFYPWYVCAKYNANYMTYVLGEMESIGRESDTFQMAFECRFLLERGMFVTDEVLYSHETLIRTGVFSEFMTPEEIDRKLPYGYSIVAGIDFAKSVDSTIVALAAVDWSAPIVDAWVPGEDGKKFRRYRVFKKHIVGFLELFGVDYERQFYAIMAYLRRIRRLRKVVLDATSVGAPLFDRFSSIFKGSGVIIEGFLFNVQSNSNGYKQFQSDLFMRRFTLPFGAVAAKKREVKKCIVQLLDAEKEIKSRGVIEVSAPDDPDAHDDYVDACMLANEAANNPTDGYGSRTILGAGTISVIR